MLPFKSKVRAVVGRGKISGGGANMSCPLSSWYLASESCFFSFSSASLTKFPLNSRCFATSGRVVGFLGETPPSSPNEIWLIPASVCCNLIDPSRLGVGKELPKTKQKLFETAISDLLRWIPGTYVFLFYSVKGWRFQILAHHLLRYQQKCHCQSSPSFYIQSRVSYS